MNNKTKSKNQLFGGQAPDSKGGRLQQESNCPGIALSEHEAELHFITLRAIFQTPGMHFVGVPVAARIPLPQDCSEWA